MILRLMMSIKKLLVRAESRIVITVAYGTRTKMSPCPLTLLISHLMWRWAAGEMTNQSAHRCTEGTIIVPGNTCSSVMPAFALITEI